eukprot:1172592-Prorocentrum_minimum.AAC.1
MCDSGQGKPAPPPIPRGVPRRCPLRVSSRLAKALYRCVAWLRDSGPNMWCGGGGGGGNATAAETTSCSRLFRRKAVVSKWLSAAMSNELPTSRMRVRSSLAGCAVMSGGCPIAISRTRGGGST